MAAYDMAAYDMAAAGFNRRRPLPATVVQDVRAACLRAAAPNPRPRVLDLGAGAGRIGQAFVAAEDDYIATDISGPMLQAFRREPGCRASRLVQADGARLPFPDAAFDVVLLVQVLSGARGWRHLLADAIRVLRRDGALIVGRVVAPDDGIDARMKARLAEILDAAGVHPYRDKPRDDAMAWLTRAMPGREVVRVEQWPAERTPQAFLERHGGGARFSVLPEPIKQDAMRRLSDWAAGQFGSTETRFTETHAFELTIHRFQQGTIT